jgi:pimeloyl-ACP methyl ester carboxylesterase
MDPSRHDGRRDRRVDRTPWSQTVEATRSFIDIEGNLAPEDCFLSRQILTHPDDDADNFLAAFAERARGSDESSSALYATRVREAVDPRVVRGVFESMVDASDHADLLSRMLGLNAPRMFMYGEQNAHLSYLPRLRAGGVELASIPHSGHWPMYAHPVAMWQAIADFLDRAS